jgi:hypothetical protein
METIPAARRNRLSFIVNLLFDENQVNATDILAHLAQIHIHLAYGFSPYFWRISFGK